EPPTTSTVPALYFVSLSRFRGTSARTSSVTRLLRVSPVSIPMSTTSTAPAWKRPGATASPTFGACIVSVTSALTTAPATSPVEASTPGGELGGHGRRLRGFDALDQPRRVLPGGAGEAGPERGVDDHVRALEPLARLQARLGEHLKRDAPVAPVRALAAHGRDAPRVREAVQHCVRNPTTRPFHHGLDVMALLGGAHLARRVERREHHSTIATAFASSRECVIERSIEPAPRVSAQRATRPLSLTEGFGRPEISTSSQAKARATPKPRALPTASLPAKRPA